MAVLTALRPIGKGLAFAVVGFLIGAGAATLLTTITDRPATQPVITLGYLFALIGWVLGVGLWDNWAREWFGLPVKNTEAFGWPRYFRFTTDHKTIGVQYLVTFVVLFLLAGLLSVLMRLELMAPGQTIMGAKDFNTTMSLHGIIMIAVAVATFLGGFANFTIPLLIGAEDVAFPRINALSYWIVPPVAVLLILTPFFGGFDTGWTAYPPLAVVNATGGLLFVLAFLTFGVSSILGGLNFLATIIMLRAPGMTWGRLPIFVWSIFAAALISLTATQFVAYGLLMIILDRVVGTAFFDAARGGKPLLYEHIFWFYSHPAVYIMILPGFGVALEVLTHFSRKPLFAYKYVVGAILAIVALSFIVWAHHLYTSGMPSYLHLPFMITTEIISIPTGVIFLAGLGTIWLGRLWLTTPMLFALAFLFNFVIGGVTGIFLADVPTDINLQDNYFVVAHFHYTIMGGEIFALMAGIYYWFPKITGRMHSEALGKVHFWWMFIAYQVTFIPMFWAGIQGMNRRVADYTPELGGINLFISVASFLLAASFLVMVYNLVRAWVRGPKASDNPWRARTLEWQTSSPPPLENFTRPPVVVGHPYDYGVPGSVHSAAAPAGGAGDKETH
ncbi:MAG: cbb3-type cytochrome c oxidase subunit I [Chloroflexi bacterium]|nr:cbb3-type cytochrome c oxidase subunit I [Chloroflexota bacterium]